MSSRLPAATTTLDATGAHPNWCSPEHCVSGASCDDVHHISAPATWRAQHDDVELSLARYRLDSHNDPGEEGWLLTVRHDGVEEEASAWLTDSDLDQLAVARMKLRVAAAGGEVIDVPSRG